MFKNTRNSTLSEQSIECFGTPFWSQKEGPQKSLKISIFRGLHSMYQIFFSHFSKKTLGIQTLSEHLKIPEFSRLRKRCNYYCFRPGRLCTPHLPDQLFPKPPIAAPAPFPPRDLCPPRGGPVAPRWRTGGPEVADWWPTLRFRDRRHLP